jgi:hypothetical protein
MMILAIAAFFASCGKQSEEQAKKAAKIDTTTTTAEVAKPAIADTAKPAVEEPKPLVVKETPVAEKKKDPPKEKAKPEPEPEKTPLMVSIPDSTPIAVKLIDSIDTDVHVTGTKFRAVLTKPIAIGGKVAFAEGAEVIGVLDKVVESGRLKTPAELSFSLISITDGFGKPVDVTTFTIDEKKGSHTNKEVGLIGGGAVVGGIIGKLTKKKGGTAIGAAAGAAAGTAVAAATGKNDIAHSAGTEITFVLRQPVRVTVK